MAGARALLADNRDEVLRLASLHGATRVRVFGSVARGEDRPDSDIDLLVEMADGRSLIDLIGFALDVEKQPGRKVDVATENGLHRIIRDQVLSEARPL